MANRDDHTVSREWLIESALENLKPWRVDSQKQAATNIVNQIIERVLGAYASQKVSRQELAERLERIHAQSLSLSREIQAPGVRRAINYASSARDMGDGEDVYNALEKSQSAFHGAPDMLKIISTSAEASIGKLDLLGPKGPFAGPWDKFQLKPKNLLALYGVRLFQEIRQSKRLPGENNKKLVDFLSLTWILDARGAGRRV